MLFYKSFESDSTFVTFVARFDSEMITTAAYVVGGSTEYLKIARLLSLDLPVYHSLWQKRTLQDSFKKCHVLCLGLDMYLLQYICYGLDCFLNFWFVYRCLSRVIEMAVFSQKPRRQFAVQLSQRAFPKRYVSHTHVNHNHVSFAQRKAWWFYASKALSRMQIF